jgi:esterase
MSDVVKLFSRDLGGAGLPPLVILHGMLGSSRNWQTVGRELSAKFHVFALDLRNHGSSPHAPAMSYPEMAADVLAWLDDHHLPRVSLLGHSMGGKVAMLLACRNPTRVERLVIVDIAPKVYRSAAHDSEFAAMQSLDLARLTSRAAAEKHLEPNVPDWAMRKFLTTNLDRDAEGKWQWLINLPGIAAALPLLEKNDLTSEDRYTGPTQVIVGGNSRYVKPDDEAAIKRYFPAATIATIPEAGHNPHMETREKFVALLMG